VVPENKRARGEMPSGGGERKPFIGSMAEKARRLRREKRERQERGQKTQSTH